MTKYSQEIPLKQVIEEVIKSIDYNQYLTPEDIAKRLKVTAKTVREWCHNYAEGKFPQLPFTKFGGKCIRIKVSDFQAFCTKHEY